jgi:23S rRNA (cytosine1962-C5)-methyltransferase
VTPSPGTAEATDGYALIDSGGGRKFERFGPFSLVRPCAQAVWLPALPDAAWAARAHAAFDRDDGNRWHNRAALPDQWTMTVDGLAFRLSSTDFGHLGIFPEQIEMWRWLDARVRAAAQAGGTRPVVLNLFAYSGGATMAAARAGAEVCHVDASRGMVQWARDNAALNGLETAPIRWIVDDVHKFLGREHRRGRRYDGVILDPPSFGRGASGEVYKIEIDLPETLELVRAAMSDTPAFVLLSAHTPGLTPLALENLLGQAMASRRGRVESGEMALRGGGDALPVPSGCYARWTASR